MTYPSPEALERQNRALSGAARAEAAREKVEAHQRAAAESAETMKALSANSGGTSAPPARDIVERVLGRVSAAAAPAIDYSGTAAKNADYLASARMGSFRR